MLSFTTLGAVAILTTSVLASPALEARAGTLKDIFPLGNNFTSWSMSSMVDGHLALQTSTFRPHNAISALNPKYEKAPDNRNSMLAHFPKGSVAYKDPLGGLSFYAPGPGNVDLTTAKEGTRSSLSHPP